MLYSVKFTPHTWFVLRVESWTLSIFFAFVMIWWFERNNNNSNNNNNVVVLKGVTSRGITVLMMDVRQTNTFARWEYEYRRRQRWWCSNKHWTFLFRTDFLDFYFHFFCYVWFLFFLYSRWTVNREMSPSNEEGTYEQKWKTSKARSRSKKQGCHLDRKSG